MRTKKNEIGVTFPVKKWINKWKNRRTHLMSSYIQQTKQHGVEQKYPPRHTIPPDTVPSVVFGISILAINGCIVLLITCYPKLRTTNTIILASLAVSKFLVGVIGIPLLVVCSPTLFWPICVTSSTFFTRTSISTMLHITVMTCDRFIYIRWALRYDDIVQHGRVFVGLCVTWFISPTSLVRLHWTLNVNIITSKVDLARVQEKETIYSRHVTSLCSFSFL